MSSPLNDDQAATPNAASADYLKSLLAQAVRESPAPPLATTLPQVSLGTEGKGLLDLVNTITQMLELSSGATAMHCILAVDFMLDQSIERLKATLASLGSSSDPPEAKAQLYVLSDVSKLLHAQRVVRDVAAFPMAAIVRDQASCVDVDDPEAMSRLLVSDTNLRSLGIDPDEYHRFVGSQERGQKSS